MSAEAPSSNRAPRAGATSRVDLLDAAVRAIRRDGAGTSMESIAAEAGITKPVVYRHFGDKSGLYRALAERYVDGLVADLEAALASVDDPHERITITIDAYLRLIEADPDVYRFLTRTVPPDWGDAAETLAGFVHTVATRIERVLAVEFHRFGLPVDGITAYAQGLVGMVKQAGDWWVEQPSMPRDELARLLSNWAWSGFSGIA